MDLLLAANNVEGCLNADVHVCVLDGSACATSNPKLSITVASSSSSSVGRAYITGINGESIIHFMNKLREQYSADKRLHIIMVQADYHRATLVQDEAKKSNINLVYLPAYSPNLNPIELLWKVMNEQVRNNRFFKSAKDFKDAINLFFDKILPEIGESLASRINDNFQKLKTAF